MNLASCDSFLPCGRSRRGNCIHRQRFRTEPAFAEKAFQGANKDKREEKGIGGSAWVGLGLPVLIIH